MLCEEFLEGYSEFLDGRLPHDQRTAFKAHREACRTCGRYDSVVRRGLHVWRNLPQIDSSPDFVPRLRHRLYHVDDSSSFSENRHLGSAALVAVASVGLLALAWLPFATRMTVEVELPAVAVEAPVTTEARGAPPDLGSVPFPSLFGSGPFVIPAAGWRDAPGSHAGQTGFDLLGPSWLGPAMSPASAHVTSGASARSR